MGADIDPELRVRRLVSLSQTFTPHAPVSRPALFRGRMEQLDSVVSAVTTPGLHVVLYGDRGVGKTSLSNIVTEVVQGAFHAAPRVNCTGSDNFRSVFRRLLGRVRIEISKEPLGFGEEKRSDGYFLAELLRNDFTPDDVAQILGDAPDVVLVLDEFDRLPSAETTAVADLIKALSDRGATSTVVLVGVARDVTELISSHESIVRSVRQVLLPRMSVEEIAEIVDAGMKATAFEFAAAEGRAQVIDVSQGYPHYTHLLCLNACKAALARLSAIVTAEDLAAGMRTAVDEADQTLSDAYFLAVTGTKKKHMWREVVLACATADTDERGYFSSRAVQERLSEILGREVIQQSVAFHLGKLTEASRGPLLHRVGSERRYRYNFSNPLMRPYIRMQDLAPS